MTRRDTLQTLVTLAGSNQAQIIKLGRGWPGRIEVKTSSGWVPVAAHVGPVGSSGRGRDDVERRFQNPWAEGAALPLQNVDGFLPVLFGLWTQDPTTTVKHPVVVAMEVTEHRLHQTTRQSYFSPIWLLQQAAEHGWAEHVSASGETIVAFWPELLSTFVELHRAATSVDPSEVAAIIGAAGIADVDPAAPIERVRRQASILVRSRLFATEVVNAYDGCCAMCGLDAGLVEGAHIYPASAPGSEDAIWNGVCLCPNHHKAFDRHLIWIQPEGARSVMLHPSLHQQASSNPGAAALVKATHRTLMPPRQRSALPKDEMFARRYEHFSGSYGWANV